MLIKENLSKEDAQVAKEHVANDRLRQALLLLKDKLPNDNKIITLNRQLGELELATRQGIISFDEQTIQRNKISKDILTYIKNLFSETDSNESNAYNREVGLFPDAIKRVLTTNLPKDIETKLDMYYRKYNDAFEARNRVHSDHWGNKLNNLLIAIEEAQKEFERTLLEKTESL